jgi:hypothetical protein
VHLKDSRSSKKSLTIWFDFCFVFQTNYAFLKQLLWHKIFIYTTHLIYNRHVLNFVALQFLFSHMTNFTRYTFSVETKRKSKNERIQFAKRYNSLHATTAQTHKKHLSNVKLILNP